MARIPPEHIERIKQEISLLRLVERQGYEVKKQGKDYVVHCPFHDDKTPSCVISPKTNLFHCFGCGAGGSVIDWVMKTQGVSFRHAIAVLEQDHPSLAMPSDATSASQPKHSGQPSLAPLPTDQDDQSVLNHVIDFYHDTLGHSPDALAYLDKRGLNDPALISHFKLCLLYTSPSPRDQRGSRMPSSA